MNQRYLDQLDFKASSEIVPKVWRTPNVTPNITKMSFQREFTFFSKGAPPVGPRFFKKRSDHMGNLLKIYFLTRWIRICKKIGGVTFEICTEVAFKNRWLQIYWISIWMMKNTVLPPPSGQIWPDLIYFSIEPSMYFPTRRFSTAVQLSNQLV